MQDSSFDKDKNKSRVIVWMINKSSAGSLTTVCSEIFAPLFRFRLFRPSYQQPNLRLGKLKCLKLSFFRHNTDLAANSRRGKAICSCRMAKNTLGENNYVYSIDLIISQEENWDIFFWINMVCTFRLEYSNINTKIWNMSYFIMLIFKSFKAPTLYFSFI